MTWEDVRQRDKENVIETLNNMRSCKDKIEAQALANFLWNEKQRHYDDIDKINNDLNKLHEKYNVLPKKIREFVVP